MRRLAVLCAFFLIFSAIEAKAEDGYVFLLKGRGNPYWTAMAEGIKDTAKEKGITPSIYFTETDRAAEEDLNTCMTMIQTKPKIIVMAATTPNIAIQCFKQATKEKIVVADIDANISIADARKAGVKMAFSVGSDNFLIGQNAAEYAKKTVAKHDPSVFVLEGAVGNIAGKKRADGFTSKLKEIMPAAKIVGSVSAEWDRLKALNTVTDLLQRQPNLDIIYAANDTMALGAVEAVCNAGKAQQIKIIGVDGTIDARKAVMNGRLTATVAQLPYLMGKRAVELALESAQGDVTEKMEIMQTPILTKEMLVSNKDPMLKYVR
ncbi:MAG: substrate-binding domain-containing protein [Bdellovibrionales bacterium]